jgi:hypothetical protein
MDVAITFFKDVWPCVFSLVIPGGYPMSIARRIFFKKNLVNHFDANLNSLSNVYFWAKYSQSLT